MANDFILKNNISQFVTKIILSMVSLGRLVVLMQALLQDLMLEKAKISYSPSLVKILKEAAFFKVLGWLIGNFKNEYL